MRTICDLLIAGMSSPSLEPAVSDSKQRSHHVQLQFETKTAHLNVIFLSILTHVQGQQMSVACFARTVKQRSVARDFVRRLRPCRLVTIDWPV
jgi:hypothetical protein